GNDSLRGGGGADFLNGLGGNDTLYGDGAGADLRGGAGDDVYVLTASPARIVELPGEGYDEVRTSLNRYDWVDYSDYSQGPEPLRIERILFTGTGNFTAFGGHFGIEIL